MVALRMDWYSLISIHKSASRAMLSECLIILDYLSREANYEHLKPYLNKGVTAISKLQIQFTVF